MPYYKCKCPPEIRQPAYLYMNDRGNGFCAETYFVASAEGFVIEQESVISSEQTEEQQQEEIDFKQESQEIIGLVTADTADNLIIFSDKLDITFSYERAISCTFRDGITKGRILCTAPSGTCTRLYNCNPNYRCLRMKVGKLKLPGQFKPPQVIRDEKDILNEMLTTKGLVKISAPRRSDIEDEDESKASWWCLDEWEELKVKQEKVAKSVCSSGFQDYCVVLSPAIRVKDE